MTAKKIMVLFGTLCIVSALAAGCGIHSTPASETAANEAGGTSPGAIADMLSPDDAENKEHVMDAEQPQENTGGKWHVLDAEVAAAVDADFEGTVWFIAEGAFSIAETEVAILDDGSLVCSAPSSIADIPDSELIQVVVDEDTYYYIRTIYSNDESYEDKEAGFGDLQEHMSVEMKGSFENDVFYASEIRMIKIS